MNPVPVAFIGTAALTGALIDHFSYGVLFALVATALVWLLSILAAGLTARDEQEAEDAASFAVAKESKQFGEG